MYIVSVLDDGAERNFQADIVTLTETDILISTGDVARNFKISQLIGLAAVERASEFVDAVIEATRAVDQRDRKNGLLN
ncbi:Hypothetical protein NGAL_HAMBI2605_34970 [Neorhizobium galegae bv. orientalis]|nr:Hypothetical protein NGAL_HAMBI2605_34970 [Neorhizobium galegae bv. orientalis]